MKFNQIVINSILAASLLLAASFAIQARPGDLDKTYGSGGIVSNTFPNLSATIVADTALQSDNKLIVVGGGKYSGDSNEPFVARYNSDGSLDTTFGSGGVVMMHFQMQPNLIDDSFFNAVAIQPDGKIIAAGNSTSNAVGFYYGDVVIIRLNVDGSLDTTFGAGGKVFTQTGTGTGFNSNGNSRIYSLAIAPEGSFYAVGGGAFNQPDGSTNFTPVLLRYSSSGALTNLQRYVFAPTANAGGTNFADLAVLQPDGKLIFANIGSSQSVTKFIIARVNPDLSLDSTFGTNGVVQTDFGTVEAEVGGIVLDPNGKIVASGNSASGNNTGDFYAARYNPNGSLDPSFGSGGKVIVAFQNAPSVNADKEGQRIVRQPDGKYISAFGARYGNFGAIRLLPTGALDPTFGYGGIAHYQTNNGSSPYPTIQGYGGFVFLQPDGKILLPGTEGNVFGVNGIKIVRLTNYARNDRADFDDDGKTDLSVVRPSGGALLWYYLRSSSNQFGGIDFGASADQIASADYDGDGKTDVAVFRPSNGIWYLLRSKLGFTSTQFGQAGDIPVPGDFDGDGKADLAVFRPSTGVWYVLRSSDGGVNSVQFGTSGDKPAVGDYDRDGRSDYGVFRPSTGTWYVLRSADNSFFAAQFGTNGDIPVAADYDGDAATDLAVFRPSTGIWYVARSSDNGFQAAQFGASGDQPTPGDFDGDGRGDYAVFRPSNGVWYIFQSLSGGVRSAQFGQNGDIAVPSAINGN